MNYEQGTIFQYGDLKKGSERRKGLMTGLFGGVIFSAELGPSTPLFHI
jgi:hypothetical protein